MAKSKENFKLKIENVLDFLKSKGHDRGKIEKRLGYSANGIDQSLSRGGSLRLLKTIELYRDFILNNSMSNSGISVPGQDADLKQLVASLRELQIAAAEVQERIYQLVPVKRDNSNIETLLNQKNKGNTPKGGKSDKARKET